MQTIPRPADTDQTSLAQIIDRVLAEAERLRLGRSRALHAQVNNTGVDVEFLVGRVPDGLRDLAAGAHADVLGAPDAKGLRDELGVVVVGRVDVGESRVAEVDGLLFEVAAEEEVFENFLAGRADGSKFVFAVRGRDLGGCAEDAVAFSLRLAGVCAGVRLGFRELGVWPVGLRGNSAGGEAA